MISGACTGDSSLTLPYFFSLKNEKILQVLGNNLKEALLNLRASRASIDHKMAVLVLDIVGECLEPETSETVNSFFTCVINSKSDQAFTVLQSVSRFIKEGHSKQFFAFASTKKLEYYSWKTLERLCSYFEKFLGLPESVKALALPRFDEGGEEWMKELLQDSHQLLLEAAPNGNLANISPLEHLLSFTNNFIKFKAEAIKYLSGLPESRRLALGVYLKIFRALEDDSFASYKEYDKTRLFKLCITMTSDRSNDVPQTYTEHYFLDLFQEVHTLYRKFGEECVGLFLDAPCLQERTSPDRVFRVLQLLNQFNELETLADLLKTFHLQKTDFNSFVRVLEEKCPEDRDGFHDDEPDLDDRFARFGGKDVNVEFPINEETLNLIRNQYRRIQQYCFEFKAFNLKQFADKTFEIRGRVKEGFLNEEDLLELIAIGRHSIRLTFGIYPYSTQILVLLGLLSRENRVFAQVKTGEGKSTIVTLLAFVLAIQGRTVDIISSSQDLAQRDFRKYANFFKRFSVASSCISEDFPAAELFQAQILYGTPSDFEFAIMNEKVYFKEFFQTRLNHTKLARNFDCVIIDEADNLSIDTLLNSARIAYPAEVSYEWVYTPLWMFLKSQRLDTVRFRTNAYVKSLVPLVRKELEVCSGGRFFNLCSLIEDQKIEDWISSGLKALADLNEGIDYVIKSTKGVNKRCEKKVVIVDVDNTGRLMESSRWGRGLHELIETKHGLEVAKESLTPISFSHVNLYTKYKSLYGLTGTLGGTVERGELQEIYGISTFDAPTHLKSLRVDHDPVLYPDDLSLNSALQSLIRSLLVSKRPILILCPNILASGSIGTLLSEENIHFQLLNEVQEEEEEEILKKAGAPCAVTVATNTAGRGTDIILTKESIANGGLAVILTSLPDERVLQQAIGRAGRQGQPGSSHVMLSRVRLGADSIQEMKKIQLAKSILLKKYHIRRAHIERHSLVYVDTFFDVLKKFNLLITNEAILLKLSELLQTRKLADGSLVSLKKLDGKKALLADEIVRLMTEKNVNAISWKFFLRQAGHYIINKALVTWSTEYYSQLESLALNQSLDLSEVVLKAKDLFEQSRAHWEPYLDLKGFSLLIADLTGIDLSDIFEKVRPSLVFDC